ncbi:MAG TPA: ABC transporter permease [Acidiferrobacter sp.]|nr:ABC transporter permease [Acidiferrobacter sp.]
MVPTDAISKTAAFYVQTDERDQTTVVLTGSWTLRGIGKHDRVLSEGLRPYAKRAPPVTWDCRQVHELDNVGALILWRLHSLAHPSDVRVRAEHEALFHRWSERQSLPKMELQPRRSLMEIFLSIGQDLLSHIMGFATLIGQVVLDTAMLVRRPARIPWKDISATIYEVGVRALGITALVGALVGVVMSYLSALELQAFGAQSFIVNILGLSILRELGPLLAAILVAGRSGSAMTAELGVMRLTEELDALSVMGISQTLRLVLPKIVALAISVPLLVIWTDGIALVGGMITAHIALGTSIASFIHGIPAAVPLVNLILGIVKGGVFGVVIALIACHFGLRIRPNTRSLGTETTNAVVTAITAVIFVDAIFAIAFRGLGLPS